MPHLIFPTPPPACLQLETSGTLDSAARIPWRPTGDGTRALHPFPERIGTPFDPPDVELTFQPRSGAPCWQAVPAHYHYPTAP